MLEEEMLLKVPPYNIHAEMSVLGAIFVDGNEKAVSRTELNSTHFYKTQHGMIFDALKACVEKQVPIDFITVQEELNARQQLESVGGFSYLVSLVEQTPTSANLEHHAKIVKEAYTLRRILQECGKTIETIYQATTPSQDVLASLNGSLSEIMRGVGGKKIKTMKEVVSSTYQKIEDRYERGKKGELLGIPSGFRDLDGLTDGFPKGELTMIGGRPGTGKTAFALAIAGNAAKMGHPVGVVEIEMWGDQLGMRSLSCEGDIPMAKVRKGRLLREDWGKLSQAAADLSQLDVYFDFESNTIPDIQGTLNRFIDLGCELAIIDYLQLIKGPKMHNREQEVASISRTLKLMSKYLHIIALCQLNRGVELRSGGKPTLADLRESGALEQDADNVIFMWPSDKEDMVNMSLSKARNCPTGEFELVYIKNKMQFKDYAGEHRTEEEPF